MFKPLSDRILIKRIDNTTMYGKIIIPESALEKSMEGEVLAVGPGKRDKHGKLEPITVKIGDKIIIGKWSGQDIKIDNEEFTLVVENDIVGVIRKSA